MVYNEKTLDITVHRASKLEDVDKFGSNDPYAFFFVDLDEVKKGVKTSEAKDGKNPKWEQQLHIEHLTDRNSTLFVEVMDHESTVDEPIAFAAIPLSQVAHAPEHTFSGEFKLFDDDGRHKGNIILTLRLRKPEDLSRDFEEGQLQEGVSEVNNDHQKRFKRLVQKEHLADAAQIAAAGAALFTGFKLFGSGQKKSAQENAKHASAREY
ncbi:hypothetical protein FBU30_003790 [Linnemannia zychae]|nr:hypothetical protein FBU30_003790 [Linnemannia zychae]